MPRSRSSKPTRRAPAAKVQIGSSAINASDLRGLQEAWEKKHLVLFLGAGLSIPYGIPSWKDLVLELLFEQAEHTRRLGDMWPHYMRALASWMTDYFDYNPLILARMVERDLRERGRRRGQGTDPEAAFLSSLRQRLYAHCKPPTGPRTALTAVADLIQRSDGHVRCAVSFNFDDLLEKELKQRGIRTDSICDGERRHSSAFRIVHPHGYVPESGDARRQHLVFTEDDYHSLTETVFHWALSEIVLHLRQNTVLFVGLSMSDPSLRRLLDACRNSLIPPHWQIQKRHQVRDSEMLAVINDVEARARKWGEIMRLPETKRPNELADAVGAALDQADAYDRDLFESMGVKTVWLENFDDIGPLLDRIGS